MKRGTRLFLLAGCAVVVALEAPLAFVALSASWGGPYARREAETRTAALPRAPSPSPVALLELARR